MRALLLAICFTGSLLVPSAYAFDGERAAQQYYDARQGCRIGEDANGPLSEIEIQNQCSALDKLGKELTDHGWCWDKSELEWAVCPKSS